MKKLMIFIFTVSLIVISCKKSNDTNDAIIQVVAANDISVTLPYSNAVILDKKQNPSNYVFDYSLLSGPAVGNKINFIPRNNDKVIVSGLTVAGVYKFQVSASYLNQTGKDFFTVTVLPDNNTYTNEVILSNLTWTNYGLYGETRIDNFYSILGGINKPYKMYIRGLADTNADWEIIAPFVLDPNFNYYSSLFQEGSSTRVITEYEADYGDKLAIKLVY